MKYCRWVGCSNIDEVPPQYHALVQKIINGQARSKKIQGSYPATFRVRLNRFDRLLITIHMMDGEPYFRVTHVIKNHDYDNPLELNDPKCLDDAKRLSVIAEDEAPEEEPDEEQYHPRAFFYGDKFILPDQHQAGVSSHLCPLVLTGPSGAGKSSVLFLAMRKKIALMREIDATYMPRILYVTKSERLAARMQTMWGEQTAHAEVKFQRYDDFLREHDPSCTPDKKITGDGFIRWLTTRVRIEQRKKSAHKMKSQVDSYGGFLSALLEKPQRVYEEFHIMPHSFEEYQLLGARQSLFAGNSIDEKLYLFETYQDYCRELTRLKQWDPCVHRIDCAEKYDLIAVDEATEISRIGALNLIEAAENYAPTDRRSEACQESLAFSSALTSEKKYREVAVGASIESKNRQVIFALDTHQRMETSLSTCPMLLNLMRGHVTHVALDSSYRSPSNILKIVNKLYSYKRALSGGAVDQYEIKSIEPRTDVPSGEVYFNHSEESAQALRPLCASAQCAVITPLKYLKEAKEKFNTYLVFTPEEIKGLEYEDIICYRLWDNADEMSDINTQLGQKSSASATFFRSSRDPSAHRFDVKINEWIVAVSRAMRRLFIVQSQTRYNENILLPLRATQGETSIASLSSVNPSCSIDAWRQQVIELLNQNFESKAREIYCQQLGYSEIDFETFKQQITMGPSTKKLTSQRSAAASSSRKSQNVSDKKAMSSMPPDALTSVLAIPEQKENAKAVQPRKKTSEKLKIPKYLSGLYKSFTSVNVERLCSNPEKLHYFSELWLPCEMPGNAARGPFIRWILNVEKKALLLSNVLDRVTAYSVEYFFNSGIYGIFALHEATISEAAIPYINLCIKKKMSPYCPDLALRTPFMLALEFKPIPRVIQKLIELMETHEGKRLSLETMLEKNKPQRGLMCTFLTMNFYTEFSPYPDSFIIKTGSKYKRVGLIELLELIKANKASKFEWIKSEKKGITEYSLESGALLPNKSALIEAIRCGDIENFNRILSERSVWSKKELSNAFFFAIDAHGSYLKEKQLEKFVAALIEYGLDVNDPSERTGCTMLIHAVQKDYYEIVKMLIMTRADVDAKTPEGMTALVSAILCRACPGIIDGLLGHGADVSSLVQINNQEVLTFLKQCSRGTVEFRERIESTARQNESGQGLYSILDFAIMCSDDIETMNTIIRFQDEALTLESYDPQFFLRAESPLLVPPCLGDSSLRAPLTEASSVAMDFPGEIASHSHENVVTRESDFLALTAVPTITSRDLFEAEFFEDNKSDSDSDGEVIENNEGQLPIIPYYPLIDVRARLSQFFREHLGNDETKIDERNGSPGLDNR